MAITTNDTWAFALHQKLFDQEVINTFALDIDTANTFVGTELAFINLLWNGEDAFFNTANNLRLNILSMQTSQVTHEKWTVKRVRGALTTTYEVPLLENVTGTRVGDCETANLAMSISRKGTFPSKRYRGRIAVAGIPTTDYAQGKFSAGAVLSGDDIVPTMIGSKTVAPGLQFTMGFFTPAHEGIVNGQVVNYPEFWVPCEVGKARETVRVQRSRTVGVGR